MYDVGDNLELDNGVIVTVLEIDEGDSSASYRVRGRQLGTGRLMEAWISNDEIIGRAGETN
jgi:hypothetical protein